MSAFFVSLPSVGTNHIKFKGLERIISSQLLTGSTPSFLKNIQFCKNYNILLSIVNPLFPKVFRHFPTPWKKFMKILRKGQILPFTFLKK